IDNQTLRYMAGTNRSPEQIELVEDYCKANMLWRENEDLVNYSTIVELDLDTVVPTVAGPKRPQDKIILSEFNATFQNLLHDIHVRCYIKPSEREVKRWLEEGGSPNTAVQDNEQHRIDTEVKTEVKNGLKTVKISHQNEHF